LKSILVVGEHFDCPTIFVWISIVQSANFEWRLATSRCCSEPSLLILVAAGGTMVSDDRGEGVWRSTLSPMMQAR
jgi:hypothetical protein